MLRISILLSALVAPGLAAEPPQSAPATAPAHAAANPAPVGADGIRLIDGDERKRWILHPPIAPAPAPRHGAATSPASHPAQAEVEAPRAAVEAIPAPDDGYGLLIVLPGGPGTPDFAPFVRDTIRPAAGNDYAMIQMIAPPIEPGKDAVVWPMQNLPDPRVEFTMEPLILAAIERARQEFEIDPERIFIFGWSSSGPLCYAMAMDPQSPLRGAFVAMSVFQQEKYPQLAAGEKALDGKSFYILHSPQDQIIPMTYPRDAKRAITAAGGRATFETYIGRHGWTGESLKRISTGLRWLEGTSDE